MKVRINGGELIVDSWMTVAALIAQRKLQPEMVVVEYNGIILSKDKWDQTMLKENDTLEVLSFVGGG